MDIIERLRFDAARCEATFSKGVATNIEEAMAEIERLRAALHHINDHGYVTFSDFDMVRNALGINEQSANPK